MEQTGKIIKSIAGFYDTKTENNKILRLRASGSLRDNNIIPVVGDNVVFRDEAVIIKVLDRKNFLIRPKVANIDQVVIIMSLTEPKFSSLLLDRLLAIIEFQNIKTIILFTKSDIGNHQPFFDYSSQGYQCFLINNNIKTSLNDLKKHFINCVSVFTGQSGVGKTTTLNNLFSLNEETNEISKVLGRGKHTTRTVEIFEKDNISIIDTPGFGSIEVKLTKQELAKSFFDFKIWSKKCKFNSCLHYKEEDCEVKRKYEEKKLLNSRYENYIKILLEMEK